MHDMLIPLALVAAVLLVSGLVSSAVQRAPFSMPMIFLGLGLLLGDGGVGALHVDTHDEGLAALAVLSLAFVLFLDAVNLRANKGQRLWHALLLALGPGTLLTAGLVAAAAHLILGLALPASLMVGAILASIDPVVLRDVVRDERVPSSIRQELTTEAGANDIIVLPLVLILAAVMRGQSGDAAEWLLTLGRIFVLGPVAGVAVGLASVWVMRQARSRIAIENEHRAIFGVGAVLAAYVVGEAVGGSGFLAILAGGAAVIATDYDLCDCLLDYS
ncbi:MAG: cation:proton antiporter, partial [Thermomicrobiales bacterium]|nr:cation:proton antiporter [Thermomicrobiales bacterium]